MSGFILSPLGAPSSLATATAAFHGDTAARTRRSSPTLALCFSGGLHAAALTLFLLATARSGLETVRTLEMRTFIEPFPSVRVEPPPSSGASRGGGDRGGIVQMVPPREAPLPGDLPVVTPGMDGLDPVQGVDRSDRGRSTQNVPGLPPPPEGNPDQPSVYDEPPVPIVAPEPIYPDIAREAGIEGRVVVHALVTRDGTVAKVDVTGANAILAEAASKAVYVWKFRPAKRKGRIVAAWIVVPVNFRLQ